MLSRTTYRTGCYELCLSHTLSHSLIRSSEAGEANISHVFVRQTTDNFAVLYNPNIYADGGLVKEYSVCDGLLVDMRGSRHTLITGAYTYKLQTDEPCSVRVIPVRLHQRPQ